MRASPSGRPFPARLAWRFTVAAKVINGNATRQKLVYDRKNLAVSEKPFAVALVICEIGLDGVFITQAPLNSPNNLKIDWRAEAQLAPTLLWVMGATDLNRPDHADWADEVDVWPTHHAAFFGRRLLRFSDGLRGFTPATSSSRPAMPISIRIGQYWPGMFSRSDQRWGVEK